MHTLFFYWKNWNWKNPSVLFLSTKLILLRAMVR